MKRLLTLVAFLTVLPAAAQSLTPAQIQTLRTNILASELAAQCVGSGDGPFVIAQAYNLPASPTWVVWTDRLTLDAVREAWVWTEIDSLTQPKQFQFEQLFASGAVDANRTAIRQGLNDIFAGAGLANSRTAIIAAAKRNATRFERIYSTGTGTTATPALLVVVGPVSEAVVRQACQP